MKQFQAKNLKWPYSKKTPPHLQCMCALQDTTAKMEVWVKSGYNEKFQLFKTYKVCALQVHIDPNE